MHSNHWTVSTVLSSWTAQSLVSYSLGQCKYLPFQIKVHFSKNFRYTHHYHCVDETQIFINSKTWIQIDRIWVRLELLNFFQNTHINRVCLVSLGIGFYQIAITTDSHTCTRNWIGLAWRHIRSFIDSWIRLVLSVRHNSTIFGHPSFCLWERYWWRLRALSLKLSLELVGYILIFLLSLAWGSWTIHFLSPDHYEENWSLQNVFLTQYSYQLSDLNPRNKNSNPRISVFCGAILGVN